MKIFQATTLALAVLGLSVGLANGQDYGTKPAPNKPAQKPADHSMHGDQGKAQGVKAGHAATLTASLVDAEAKARQQAATVKVDVTGVKMTDPGLVKEKPMAGQGHLHYQVDDGPVIATTTQKLSFHGLKPGAHRVKVALAANDHSPLGPEQTLDVTIPTAAATAP
jgi:hypothetical protein